VSSRGASQRIPQDALWVGTVVGDRYEILRRLGGGAIGDVYLAADRHLSNREVALKILSRAIEGGPHAREISSRFLLEAQALAAIRDDHVVSILNYGVMSSGTPYLVMEYLAGESLEALLRSVDGRRLPIGRAVDIAIDVCGGVHICHTKDVVHRDLKPANIFIERTPRGERAKIVDFGIAKTRASAKFSQSGVMMGTPSYMAPEQLARGISDARSDQYALGVVLFRCLTGDVPRGETDPRSSRSDVPDVLADVTMRALATDPSDRYPTVHALGRALMPFASVEVASRWRGYYQAPPALRSGAGTKTLVIPSAWLRHEVATRTMVRAMEPRAGSPARLDTPSAASTPRRRIDRRGALVLLAIVGVASALVANDRGSARLPYGGGEGVTVTTTPVLGPTPGPSNPPATPSEGGAAETISCGASLGTTWPTKEISRQPPKRPRSHVAAHGPIRVRYTMERDPILE
jgi:serine/threonine protein kinase